MPSSKLELILEMGYLCKLGGWKLNDLFLVEVWGGVPYSAQFEWLENSGFAELQKISSFTAAT